MVKYGPKYVEILVINYYFFLSKGESKVIPVQAVEAVRVARS
jgi:hypothetical protein